MSVDVCMHVCVPVTVYLYVSACPQLVVVTVVTVVTVVCSTSSSYMCK